MRQIRGADKLLSCLVIVIYTFTNELQEENQRNA